MTKYKFRHNKFYTKNYIQPFSFCYFTSSLTRLSLSHKKFQTQSPIHFASPSPIYRRLTVTDSLLVGPSRRFSSQLFAPHRCRFASRRSVTTLQLAMFQLTTFRASPSPICFSPVRRNASARNGSRFPVVDFLLDSSSRCFSSQRFVPHHRRFASCWSVVTFQLKRIHILVPKQKHLYSCFISVD